MTLNLTVANSEQVYQCSDFRLTINGSSEHVPGAIKSLAITNSTFSALLTYTGVGRVGQIDTIDVISRWVCGAGDNTLDDVRLVVASEAGKWLTKLGPDPETKKPRLHSIILVGYEIDKPSLAQISVISNFESAFSLFEQAQDDVNTHTIFVGKKPFVIVTGEKRAVSRQDRRQLQHQARRRIYQPQAIRNEMQECNVRAAGHPRFGEVISPDCMVASMDRDGTGVQAMRGELPGSLRTVAFGKPVPDWASLVPELKRHRVVAANFTRIDPGRPSVARAQACNPSLITADPDYEIRELFPMNDESCDVWPRSINSSGSIAGDLAPVGNHPERRFWYTHDGKTFGDPQLRTPDGGRSITIDDRNRLLGGVVQSDTWTSSFLWEGGDLVMLGRPGTPSDLTAVAGGFGVGWVSVLPHDGQRSRRAAMWNLETRQLDLILEDEFYGSWGQAVDVLEDRTMLLSVNDRFETLPVLRRANGVLSVIGGDAVRGLHPLAIDVDGRVLASGRSSQGAVVGLLFEEEKSGWRNAGLPDGWLPTAMSRSGIIVGSRPTDGSEQPWIMDSSGRVRLLPYYRYHVCRPTAVSDLGKLTGYAATDHGYHGLVWSSKSC